MSLKTRTFKVGRVERSVPRSTNDVRGNRITPKSMIRTAAQFVLPPKFAAASRHHDRPLQQPSPLFCHCTRASTMAASFARLASRRFAQAPRFAIPRQTATFARRSISTTSLRNADVTTMTESKHTPLNETSSKLVNQVGVCVGPGMGRRSHVELHG